MGGGERWGEERERGERWGEEREVVKANESCVGGGRRYVGKEGGDVKKGMVRIMGS